MNIKEAFRYQSFMDSLLSRARMSILAREHAYEVTRTHNRKKANPEAEDIIETVEVADFYCNDDVIMFLKWLITEKESLTCAIHKAKSSLDFCFDAAIESNKFRQQVSGAIDSMLKYSAKKATETGRDYKFNVEGNQTPYIYDVEVEYKENYDRKTSKGIARDLIEEADKISAKIDAATINTIVDYTPKFNVNDSFEDVMENFVENIKPTILKPQAE